MIISLVRNVCKSVCPILLTDNVKNPMPNRISFLNKRSKKLKRRAGHVNLSKTFLSR